VEQLEALRQIDSPTVSNAIEHFGVRPRVEGYAGWELRCAFPEQGTMLGYAVTCARGAGSSRHYLIDDLN
jgi:hypothetical protein